MESKSGARRRIVRGGSGLAAGSALVEMVVIAPLLLLILIGLIEAGRAGDFALKVGNAARAAVQYGAQNTGTAADNPGITSAAQNDAGNPSLSVTPSYFCQCTDGSASTCAQANACSTNHQIEYLKVIVSGTMPSLFNYYGLPASLRNVTVTQTVTTRVIQ